MTLSYHHAKMGHLNNYLALLYFQKNKLVSLYEEARVPLCLKTMLLPSNCSHGNISASFPTNSLLLWTVAQSIKISDPGFRREKRLRIPSAKIPENMEAAASRATVPG